VVVPDGFLPGALATDFEGEFIAIDITTGESLRFATQDVGISGALSGTLLSNGVVVLAGGNGVSVFDNGLSEVPTTLRAGFPAAMVPTPDPTQLWLVEGRPPWRMELHSVTSQSVTVETSIDLAEEVGMGPVGATADGLVLQAVVYEDHGIPTPESESVYLVEPSGDIQNLGNGVVLTFGQHAIYLRECDESGCGLTEIRTDTGDRREVSNRAWNTPTASGDTGEASDQWSVVSPSGAQILLTDDSGVVVLDLQTSHIEPIALSSFSLAAWMDDRKIVVISDGSVQTVSPDEPLRTVATIPDGFFVLDAGY
jgi:DNA-binding beta-propeller fold protein YncE